jgi:hypothetical protein
VVQWNKKQCDGALTNNVKEHQLAMQQSNQQRNGRMTSNEMEE